MAGFEVIITDDSPDNCIEKLLEETITISLHYYKMKAIGLACQWNAAIKKNQWHIHKK